MEHLKRINLDRTAIAELPSSFENLPGLKKLSVSDCSKLDKLPDNIGNLESLRHISAAGSAISLSSLGRLNISYCAVMEIPQEIACLSSLTGLDLSGNNFECLPASIRQLSRLWSLDLEGCKMLQSLPELPLCLESLDLTDCKMLRSLPELPLCLQSLNARNCKRLESLPEIPSCLQELDASVLEKLSKPSPDLRQWGGGWLESQAIYFGFTNCLKLNGKANNKILADSLLSLRHMAIASLRLGYEMAINEVSNSLSCLLCPSLLYLNHGFHFTIFFF
ncbi:ADP-ribosyl cyclase/cyclic ADP-ribose hydrolase [Citrus sinensis]|nr:ADP-ribosyl cyclase/cyclic ADP-ribose hydrolase [Citrus sinensis]